MKKGTGKSDLDARHERLLLGLSTMKRKERGMNESEKCFKLYKYILGQIRRS